MANVRFSPANPSLRNSRYPDLAPMLVGEDFDELLKL